MAESVYPAICGSFELHGEHSWREGFLWNRKVTCLGSARTFELTESEETIDEHFHELLNPTSNDVALVPMQIILPHEHFYRLTDTTPIGVKRDSDIVWECAGCRHFFIIDRAIWHSYPAGITYDVTV